jgi:hypothetical protein
MNKNSLNYALNSHGRIHVELNNLQWVRSVGDGHYVGLDFANQWDSKGNVIWLSRAAHFQLKSGESAKLTKDGEMIWRFEMSDGAVPWFV